MRKLVLTLGLLVFIALFVIVIKRSIKTPAHAPAVFSPAPKKLRKSFSDAACAETYLKLFDQPIITIQVVFGYKDARPARFVDDRYEEMIFIQRITSACTTDREDCGFQLSRTEANQEAGEVFTKTLRGPDGEEKTIRLAVAHSSAGADDDDNRKNPYQKWRTDYARRVFLEALKAADIVFYNGHSRSGGGPDFAPPILDRHDHVKYSVYKAKGASLAAMQTAIHSSRHSNLQLVGLFSCASEQLFTQKLTRAKPGVGIISSRQLLYFSDALENSLLSLSAVLEMKCRPEWSGLFDTKTDLRGFWSSPNP